MQGNLKSYHLNKGSDQATDHNGGLDAAVPSKISLLLPYKSLKTPSTDFAPASVSVEINPTEISVDAAQLADESHRQALIIATCTGLFFRYSGQSVIPLVLQSDALDGHARHLYLKTQAAMSIKALCEQIDSQMQSAVESTVPPAPDREIPLAIVFNSGLEKQADSALQADLSLIFTLRKEHWLIQLRYNQSLFQRQIMQQLAAHLKQCLYSVELRQPLKSMAILSSAEIQRLRQLGEGPAHTFSQLFPHQLIEQHARNRAQSQAVIFQKQSLNYATLNQQANQLARLLIQQGATGDSRIMVMLEPCLEVPLILLAIFKLGATYVPLEPSYPKARMQTIYQDTEAAITITQSHLLDSLEQVCHKPHSLCVLESLIEALPAYAADNLNCDIDENQLAYIYYTSGTTGKPKGVMASYQNLRHYIQVAHKQFGYSAEDIIPCVARFTFSISMFELLSPLYAGGQLLVLPRNHILDPACMSQTLQTVTAAHIGPALLKSITHYIESNVIPLKNFANLRHISSGGDMIPPELLTQLQTLFVNAEHYVIYGCSEISCMGCRWFIPTNKSVKQTFVGQPFENVQVILVDDDDNLVPQGVVGNVCFAGHGVVKGYLNRDELHAEKFFQFDGRTFYRTGDRGRWHLNGQLELLGRLDFQIKLRGMRIELAELEYHLRRCPGVKDGVIACRQTTGGEKILIAYYVAENPPKLTKDNIRYHMAEQLPDYMVPAIYQQLTQLPLNANLKVDRNALPEILSTNSRQGTLASSAPEKFLSLWFQRELHVERVFVEDNLFELGGDSFLAMNLILDLEKQFAVTLTGMDIVRESICVLARRLAPQSEQASIPIEQTATRKVAPFETFYFGDSDALFGIFHPPQIEYPRSPILICPPMANEHPRSYFFIRYLAEQLCAEGHPVLRFDYFATGNSSGRAEEATIARWQQDQLTAFQHLAHRVPNRRIIVIAARLGALLWLTLSDKPETRQLILWDPIVDGQAHINLLRAMHRKKVAKLFTIKGPWFREPLAGKTQLAGFSYSPATLDAICTLSLAPEHFSSLPGLDWLACENLSEQKEYYQMLTAHLPQSQFIPLKSAPYWYQDFLTDDGLSHPELMQQLARLVDQVPL